MIEFKEIELQVSNLCKLHTLFPKKRKNKNKNNSTLDILCGFAAGNKTDLGFFSFALMSLLDLLS